MVSSKELTASFSLVDSLYYTCLTTIGFALFNPLVGYCLGHVEFLKNHPNKWRFKNTFISWTHAILASILVLINMYQSPELFSDMINLSTRFSYIEICISLGYFMYDAIDIIFVNKKLTSQSYEVLAHHFLIIFIFCVPLTVNRFVGYTIGALSIEFNTVFLHLRFLFAFCGVDKHSLQYKIMSILNIVTFILFRIVTLCWMTRWLVLNRHLVHVGWFTVGSVGLAIMMVINIFLLQRLIDSDFKTTSGKKNTKHTANVSASAAEANVQMILKENGNNLIKHD